MSTAEGPSEFAAEIAILRGQGPPLDDPDPASLAEREVNRRWAAIRRLGENHVYGADDLIRRQLYAADPSLRAEALHVLLGIWHRMDLLAYAINIAADRDEHRMVRMVSVEALGASGAIETDSIRHLIEELATHDDDGVVRRTAMETLGRG